MLATKIRLAGQQGQNIDLPFDSNADVTDSYILKSIDGLGPPDVAVAVASTPSGGKYQGRTPSNRQIVALVGLNPNFDKGETVENLRTNLYTLLSTGYDPRVRIQIYNGTTEKAYIWGYVSKFETSHFAKDALVQITFDCTSPTFRYPTTKYLNAAALPDKNPVIRNIGTAESGFQMSVKFTDNVNGWFIKTKENQNIGMIFNHSFNTNDVLSFSTIPGNRYIRVQPRRKKSQNIMGSLSSGSEWLTLHAGDNHFITGSPLKIDFVGHIVYTPLFWGV